MSQEMTVKRDAPAGKRRRRRNFRPGGRAAGEGLPLNGRSYDLLLPLNPGVVNFTSEKTGGTGISNSTNGE